MGIFLSVRASGKFSKDETTHCSQFLAKFLMSASKLQRKLWVRNYIVQKFIEYLHFYGWVLLPNTSKSMNLKANRLGLELLCVILIKMLNFLKLPFPYLLNGTKNSIWLCDYFELHEIPHRK